MNVVFFSFLILFYGDSFIGKFNISFNVYLITNFPNTPLLYIQGNNLDRFRL